MVFRAGRASGFTLTELMATIAIAAVGASLALPALTGAVADQQRAGAINELVSSLHLARNTAITRNAAVTVCASNNGETCTDSNWELGWIVFPDADLDRSPDSGELLASGRPGGQILLRSDEFSPHLSYRPAGQLMIDRPDQNSGEFVVCDPLRADAARVVVILPAGMPRLTDKRLNGAAPQCPEE
jgi:type IV fimbrial biogenesis protein FimT